MPMMTKNKIEMITAQKKATLYIEGVIGFDFWGDAWDANYFRQKVSDLEAKGITHLDVCVHSPGGNLDDALSIFNTLATFEGDVVGNVTGFAGSSASFILMAMDKVYMPENTAFHLHNPHTEMQAATAAQLQKTAENMKSFQEIAFEGYMHRFNGSEEELKKLMHEDTFMTAAEASTLFSNIELISVVAEKAPLFSPDMMCDGMGAAAAKYFNEKEIKKESTLGSVVGMVKNILGKNTKNTNEEPEMTEAETKKLVSDSVAEMLSGDSFKNALVGAVEACTEQQESKVKEASVAANKAVEVAMVAFNGDMDNKEDVEAHLAKIQEAKMRAAVDMNDPASVEVYLKNRFKDTEAENAAEMRSAGSNAGIDFNKQTSSDKDDEDTLAVMLAASPCGR